MTRETEKRILQVLLIIGALLPVSAGAAGVLLGPGFLRLSGAWPADLDSHLRFLSGVFLVVGLAWWSCVPQVEQRTERLRLLAAMTFAGGLARLLSLGLMGPPSTGHRIGLFMELVVVPLIVIWQRRVAWRFSR